MASQSLDVTLKLSSDNAINGILTLNTTENDTLTFDDTEVLAKTLTVTHGAAIELIVTGADDTYIYIKNTDVTNRVEMQISAGTPYANIHPGEFILICIKSGRGLKVQAITADCICEYVTFKKG